ncbi:hypothetical protein [Deinococcus peraridilitoris]|uniref:Uncharacterized protein n=1 Tax=Deinococcus peraridilitoris (strain DSM 19664 / LMG 22246 / CIP 109416 / KR-200) TaxID=937777 RepID=L0A143_DEIPD|nr:hypothetical protein [Deinococcus peraridilitoris]AFZ67593.1 hypothetical protein Deipe_2098 [Deinococcus peraridilitoris DSM 19664]
MDASKVQALTQTGFQYLTEKHPDATQSSGPQLCRELLWKYTEGMDDEARAPLFGMLGSLLATVQAAQSSNRQYKVALEEILKRPADASSIAAWGLGVSDEDLEPST